MGRGGCAEISGRIVVNLVGRGWEISPTISNPDPRSHHCVQPGYTRVWIAEIKGFKTLKLRYTRTTRFAISVRDRKTIK